MNDPAQTADCCPQFNPIIWDGKIFEWQNKKFIKGKVCTLFYMPMNFGSVMKKLSDKVDKAGAKASEWLALSDHTSKWNMDLYLAVDKEVPDAKNFMVSGKFFSKVYEGDFKETGSWMRDFQNLAKERNYAVSKQYLWYTTCPKCAQKYGKNYVVIIGQI